MDGLPIFARRIRALREGRGWSANELGRRVAEVPGCDRVGASHVQKWESGSPPSATFLDGLAHVFGVPVDSFLLDGFDVGQKVWLVGRDQGTGGFTPLQATVVGLDLAGACYRLVGDGFTAHLWITKVYRKWPEALMVADRLMRTDDTGLMARFWEKGVMGKILVEHLLLRHIPEERYREVDADALRWSRGFPPEVVEKQLEPIQDPPPDGVPLSPPSADPPRPLGTSPLAWALRPDGKWWPVQHDVRCYGAGTSDDCEGRAVRYYQNRPCCETCYVHLIVNETF